MHIMMFLRRRRRTTRTNCIVTCFANHMVSCIVSYAVLLLCCAASHQLCAARDTLTCDTPIRDDVRSETLVSAGGKFELGFFSLSSPGSSGLDRRYVGIWYHHKPSLRTVVWVANRENPVAVNSTGTGVLAIKEGNLQVLNNTTGKSYWSTGLEPSKSFNRTVKLMDSGNLVLFNGDDAQLAVNKILWQSFQSPTDTFIPEMTMEKGLELTSWRSESTVRDCEPCGTTIIPSPLSTGPDCGDPVYFRFDCSAYQLYFIGQNGTFFRVIKISPSTHRFFIQARVDNCDPKNRVKGQQLNLSLPFKGISHRGCSYSSSEVSSQGTEAVELGWELLEPTCTTYADCRDWPHSTCNPARDGNKRCLCNSDFQWNSLKLNCTQEKQSRRKMPWRTILIVAALLTSVIFLACIASVYIWRRKTTKRRGKRNRAQLDGERLILELDTSEFKEEDEKGIDVPFFDLQSILDATDNFSDANKLGQGGYGPVFKGKFLGAQEIAVKRLSRGSGQGLQEFKNEVLLIAKLQHRNLVRLKGYCMKGKEKILLYEYMPNKSLDSFIFDRTQRVFLNWTMRVNIILGIARGLVYLHQDSRLRIIHRDLKTSNILLDEDMNPKISDFGLARIVGGKETEANTSTIVGTYGYMSPEYALDGIFSVKSDVFSFGVVVLEIISGKRNTGAYQSKQTFSLINDAWRLWTENKVLDLMDKDLDESCNKSQFMKCANVGLLCVEENPSDRPTMSNVIAMLGSETAIPPTPKQPAFVVRDNNSSSSASCSSKPESCAQITTTVVEGR